MEEEEHIVVEEALATDETTQQLNTANLKQFETLLNKNM